MATPKLLGWMELAGDTEKDACTLSILQAFAPNQGDGWSWMLQRLGEGAEGHDLALDGATAWLQRLGTRTAEMHKAARESEDPAFAPQWSQPTTSGVGERRHKRWRGARWTRWRCIVRALSPAAQGIADSLIGRRERIAAQLDVCCRSPAASCRLGTTGISIWGRFGHRR